MVSKDEVDQFFKLDRKWRKFLSMRTLNKFYGDSGNTLKNDKHWMTMLEREESLSFTIKMIKEMLGILTANDLKTYENRTKR